ncbi:putative DNA-directed RNA polymerase III subunit RPC6 [Cryptosporidium serpentis]
MAEKKTVISTDILQEAYKYGCKNNNELTPEMLQSLGWDNSLIIRILNIFTEKRLCSIKKSKLISGNNQNKVSFILRSEIIASKLNKLTPDEYQVYCCIENAGNQGIWTADIRKVTGLQTHIVQRAVKLLYSELNLIKPIKSIHVKNRKVYILASLEPSKEIAGGTFYDNGEFDMTFVDYIQDKIIAILVSKRRATINEILDFINSESSVDTCSSRRSISLSDLESVLNMLTIESKILCFKMNNTGEWLYMCIYWPSCLSTNIGVEDVPCLSCPVFNTCSGLFNTPSLPCPQECKYLNFLLDKDISLYEKNQE